MKACPGLRSGIDCSGILSFAIRGIPSSIRPPIRHSGEGRNPEGWGDGNVARGACPPPTADRGSTGGAIFILLRGLANAMVIPAKARPGLRYGSGIQGRRGRRDRSRNPKTLRIMQRWGLSQAHGAPGSRPNRTTRSPAILVLCWTMLIVRIVASSAMLAGIDDSTRLLPHPDSG